MFLGYSLVVPGDSVLIGSRECAGSERGGHFNKGWGRHLISRSTELHSG